MTTVRPRKKLSKPLEKTKRRQGSQRALLPSSYKMPSREQAAPVQYSRLHWPSMHREAQDPALVQSTLYMSEVVMPMMTHPLMLAQPAKNRGIPAGNRRPSQPSSKQL